MRTIIGQLHFRVLQSAPEDMKERMAGIAVDCLARRYAKESDLDTYLDMEDFYYNELIPRRRLS